MVYDQFRVFVAPFGQRINYSELLLTFQMSAWFAIAVMFCVMTFVMFALFQMGTETIFSSSEQNIQSAVAVAYLTLLMRANSRLPVDTFTGRISTAAVLLFGLYILSLFRGAVLSKLAVKKPGLPVNSLEDVLLKDFTLGIFAGTNQEAYFKDAPEGSVPDLIWKQGWLFVPVQ